MKKLILGLAASVAMLATSCQQEFDAPAAGNGTATVSATIGLPQPATRAVYSDGTSATVLQYSVYDKTAGTKLNKYTVTDTDFLLEKEIQFQLITGHEYSFVFWAAHAEAPYAVTFGEDGTATMEVTYTGIKANNEQLDAFFAHRDIKVTGDSSETFELKRPFAQINVGTSDYTEAAEVAYNPTLSKIEVANVYTTLNLVDGSVSNETKVVYDYNTIARNETFPYEPDTYEYLAMTYALVNSDRELVEVLFAYKEGENTQAESRTVGSVPVLRNHRTNIFGQILTSNVAVNVVIKPAYDEPDNDVELPKL